MNAPPSSPSDKIPFWTPGTYVLSGLLLVGLALAAYRFLAGIGSVANLNDAYPWGLWVALKLALVALAAGGFTLTAITYVWQTPRYHGAVRPAVVTAMLGYTIFVIALLVDLGRYYRIWHVLWPPLWQHDSVMFEIAWCVTMYLTVLIFEFLPVVFERFGWGRAAGLYQRIIPLLVIFMLSVFTIALAHAWWWVAVTAAVMVAFELLRAAGIVSSHHGPPALLIVAGVVLSCLHQSGLGSLYLIVPSKLHPLWYSPLLPIIFLLSAVAVGPAMVIFESIVSGRVFRRELRLDVATGLARLIPPLLAVLLAVRAADLLVRGAIRQAFEPNIGALMFWIEVVIGYLTPMVLLAMPAMLQRRSGLLAGAMCVIIGVVIHRFDTALTAFHATGWQSYTPAMSEVLVSVGLVCLALLAYRLIALNFPVFERKGDIHLYRR